MNICDPNMVPSVEYINIITYQEEGNSIHRDRNRKVVFVSTGVVVAKMATVLMVVAVVVVTAAEVAGVQSSHILKVQQLKLLFIHSTVLSDEKY